MFLFGLFHGGQQPGIIAHPIVRPDMARQTTHTHTHTHTHIHTHTHSELEDDGVIVYGVRTRPHMKTPCGQKSVRFLCFGFFCLGAPFAAPLLFLAALKGLDSDLKFCWDRRQRQSCVNAFQNIGPCLELDGWCVVVCVCGPYHSWNVWNQLFVCSATMLSF